MMPESNYALEKFPRRKSQQEAAKEAKERRQILRYLLEFVNRSIAEHLMLRSGLGTKELESRLLNRHKESVSLDNLRRRYSEIRRFQSKTFECCFRIVAYFSCFFLYFLVRCVALSSYPSLPLDDVLML